MKLTFSTEFIPTRSFLDTCRVAYEYGYDAFEIFDAAAERADHAASPEQTSASRAELNTTIKGITADMDRLKRAVEELSAKMGRIRVR